MDLRSHFWQGGMDTLQIGDFQREPTSWIVFPPPTGVCRAPSPNLPLFNTFPTHVQHAVLNQDAQVDKVSALGPQLAGASLHPPPPDLL